MVWLLVDRILLQRVYIDVIYLAGPHAIPSSVKLGYLKTEHLALQWLSDIGSAHCIALSVWHRSAMYVLPLACAVRQCADQVLQEY